jgi:hypothetical protein
MESSWNKPFQSEEILRWNIVEGFVKYIYKNNNIELNLCIIFRSGLWWGWLTNLLLKYGNIVGIEPVNQFLIMLKNVSSSGIYLWHNKKLNKEIIVFLISII